jgi:hypothetical protein
MKHILQSYLYWRPCPCTSDYETSVSAILLEEKYFN